MSIVVARQTSSEGGDLNSLRPTLSQSSPPPPDDDQDDIIDDDDDADDDDDDSVVEEETPVKLQRQQSLMM